MHRSHWPLPTPGQTPEQIHENQVFTRELIGGFFERAGIEILGSLPPGDRPIVLAYDHDDATDPFYPALAALHQRPEKTFVLAAKRQLNQPLIGRWIEQIGGVWVTRPEHDENGNKLKGNLALDLGRALAEGMAQTPAAVALLAPESSRRRGAINKFTAGAVLAASLHTEMIDDGLPTDLVIAGVSGNRLRHCIFKHDNPRVIVNFGAPVPIGKEVIERYRQSPVHPELRLLRHNLRRNMLDLVNETEEMQGSPLSILDEARRKKGMREKFAAEVGKILHRDKS